SLRLRAPLRLLLLTHALHLCAALRLLSLMLSLRLRAAREIVLLPPTFGLGALPRGVLPRPTFGLGATSGCISRLRVREPLGRVIARWAILHDRRCALESAPGRMRT